MKDKLTEKDFSILGNCKSRHDVLDIFSNKDTIKNNYVDVINEYNNGIEVPSQRWKIFLQNLRKLHIPKDKKV